MTTLLFLAAYGVAVVVAAGGFTRISAHMRSHPRCHAENTYAYARDRDSCHRRCKPDCWRKDPLTIAPNDAVKGSLAALAWPVLLLPVIAYLAAKPRVPRSSYAAEIARLERELQIGDA